MEPVLLVCGGCGVRLRTSDPTRARTRTCPRCQSSLDQAVDRVLGVEPMPVEETCSKREARTRRPKLIMAIGSLILLIAMAALTIVVVRGTDRTVPPRIASDRPKLVIEVPRIAPAALASVPSSAGKSQQNVGPDIESQSVLPDLSPPPPSPANDLALLDPDRRDPTSIRIPGPEIRTRSNSLDLPPPPAPVPATGTTETPSCPKAESRRLLVRDQKGRAIVAREQGMVKDRLAVMLPDGRIGWPSGQVVTQEPFVPLTMEQMRRSLLDDPEFTTFRLLQTTHYLILYQSSTDTFARASGDLLEKLHDGLTGFLRKNGLPVRSLEFPLVAVIFETEADFRANRQVPPDIQAYYEILSNRIFFYEKSRRDQDSPEVSALRKPQTVAHEGTHQILHNVGLQPRMSDWPLWLVEGLAEYCSPPKLTKRGVDWAGLGQVNSLHIATIRDLDDPLPNQFQVGGRPPLVSRDRRTPLVEYLVTQKELTPTDYALAWALTHYLISKRIDDFVTYIERMSQLKPGQEQSPQDQLTKFRAVFGNDLVQMDGKVANHLKKLKVPDVLPFYAVIFEQQVGPLIRRQAMVSQSPSVIRQWLESVTVPEGGQPHWEFLPQPNRNKAIEVVEHWMHQGN